MCYLPKGPTMSLVTNSASFVQPGLAHSVNTKKLVACAFIWVVFRLLRKFFNFDVSFSLVFRCCRHRLLDEVHK